MFKSACCGGGAASANGGVIEMEKHVEESLEKDTLADAVVIAPDSDTGGQSEETMFKLTYFNARIGGEAIRFILSMTGSSFEDHRIEESDWPELKNGMKWGKLPVLEFDGNSIYSATAIARYLAKRFGLMGENEIDAAHCDEFVEVCQDTRTAWARFFFEEDEAKKEEAKNHLIDSIFPDVLPKLNSSVESNTKGVSGNWLVGENCTWADLFVANFLEVCEDSVDPKILDEYPALKKLKEDVLSIPEIQKYVETRPETSH